MLKCQLRHKLCFSFVSLIMSELAPEEPKFEAKNDLNHQTKPVNGNICTFSKLSGQSSHAHFQNFQANLVCVHAFPNKCNFLGRTVLYVCIEYCI